MPTCTETGAEIQIGGEVFAASRIRDPIALPLSSAALARIPKSARDSREHTYKNKGGINVYVAKIDGDGGVVPNKDDGFLFSILPDLVENFLPKTALQFNFPGQDVRVA